MNRKRLFGRPYSKVAAALFGRQHYRAAGNMLKSYVRPIEGWRRYLFQSGSYPAAFDVRTPLGIVRPVLYSYHDFLTLNEVFCRKDYQVDRDLRTVLDVGSNIGISALYFLTRSADVRVHCYEPLPQNIERLRENTAPFSDRVVIHQEAVGTESGVVEFGYESTGRYGGIGLRRPKSISVRCREMNEVVSEVLSEGSEIDLVKIDIEGLEEAVLRAVEERFYERIRHFAAEGTFDSDLLAPRYTYRQYGSVGRFARTDL